MIIISVFLALTICPFIRNNSDRYGKSEAEIYESEVRSIGLFGRKSMNSRDQLLKSWERTTGFLRDARALISEAGEGICSDEIVEFQSCLDHNELECALTMLDENRGVSHEWH
jgi:hypothetical protein